MEKESKNKYVVAENKNHSATEYRNITMACLGLLMIPKPSMSFSKIFQENDPFCQVALRGFYAETKGIFPS